MAVINGNNAANRLNGTQQADTIHGNGGDDIIRALNGNDSVFGDADNDGIGGGSGNDFLNGGTGRDFAQGGPNNDVLFGGVDNRIDNLRGGNGGSDEFWYSTTGSGDDSILDFGEQGRTPNDFVNLINVTDQQIGAAYGTNINAGDAGVTNAGGDLLIDFGAVGLGTGTLSLVDGFTTLGAGGLVVGDDIIGSGVV